MYSDIRQNYLKNTVIVFFTLVSLVYEKLLQQYRPRGEFIWEENRDLNRKGIAKLGFLTKLKNF